VIIYYIDKDLINRSYLISIRRISGLIIWTDGSKRESETAGSGIAWKRGPRWLGKGLALGKGKEAFDAEL
jgi:hypothetical protein